MSFHKTKKLLSGVVVFFFLVSDLARANPAFLSAGQIENKPALEISFPPELGTVQESFLPSPAQEAPLVFHLQTAHAHYESSIKIKEIIRYLKDHYKIRLVFAEGASEALHPEFLQFFPDPALNRKMIDSLAQKGELTGVDLSLSDSKLQAVGIEDPVLYRAAYKYFKKVLESSDQTQVFLDETKLRLDRKASGVFSRELRELVSTWQKFNSGQRDLLAAIKLLHQESKKLLRLDFEDPFSQFAWPQLTRLVLLVLLSEFHKST